MVIDQGEWVTLEIHASLNDSLCNLTFFLPTLGGLVLLDWTASLFGSRNFLAQHSGRANEEHRGPAWEGRCCQRSSGGGYFFLLWWMSFKMRNIMPYASKGICSLSSFQCSFHCLPLPEVFTQSCIFRLLGDPLTSRWLVVCQLVSFRHYKAL